MNLVMKKVKLIKEYKNFKTLQIKSCFEPICSNETYWQINIYKITKI